MPPVVMETIFRVFRLSKHYMIMVEPFIYALVVELLENLKVELLPHKMELGQNGHCYVL